MAWQPQDIEGFWTDAFDRNLTLNSLAERHNGTFDTVNKFKRRLREKGLEALLKEAHAAQVRPQLRIEEGGMSEEAEGPSSRDCYSEGGKVRVIELKETPLHTLDELLVSFKVDQDVWAVDRFEINAYPMGYKKRSVTTKLSDSKSVTESEAGFIQLYQCKAILKRRQGVQELKDVIDRLFKKAAEHAPLYLPMPRPQTSTGRLLEINPVDHHMGKLAWKPESGQTYDIKIAKRMFVGAITSLVNRATSIGPVDRIALILGNDLLQMDNSNNTTTSGTAVDCDGRYAKVYDLTCDMCIEIIDWLMTIADVDIIMVPGNHDELTTFHLGKFLSAWYRNCSQVTIDNTPKSRKYYRWGENLFLYTHGNNEKIDALPLIMAQEQKKDWGTTTFRFVKLGHFHKKKVMTRVDVDEELGVQTMICPSLCAADEWHNKNGYIANIRRSEAHIYDWSTGPEGVLIYNLPLEEQAA